MITGGCLCGHIRYEAGGEPLFAVHCHCRDCQRSSGTGHVPVMGVAKELFKVSGETKSYVTVGSSQRKAIRHFCPNCGSLLFGTPEVAPDTVTIYVGSLDDPAVFKPAYVLFTRDRPPWDTIAGGLPEFATVPPQDGTKN
jgi:hypothetical protein